MERCSKEELANEIKRLRGCISNLIERGPDGIDPIEIPIHVSDAYDKHLGEILKPYTHPTLKPYAHPWIKR